MMLNAMIVLKYLFVFALCLMLVAFYCEWKQEGFSWGVLFVFIKAGVVFAVLVFLSKYVISLLKNKKNEGTE